MPRQRRCSAQHCPAVGQESDSFGEVVLRVAVESDSREAAECFSREFMPWITAGPQGTTGYAEGRPRIHPVFRYWPCLIARDEVSSLVEILTSAENAAGKLKSGDRRIPQRLLKSQHRYRSEPP